jgi:antitoxin component of MazEF toxin-antitoxin module
VIRNLQLVLFQAKRLKKEDKHMAKKNERELKVCAMSGYNYKSVPAIRLMGQWLEAAGFHIGDPVLVKCEDGKLIISLNTARAELMEAEKAFMEKETRRLHERLWEVSFVLNEF